MELAPSARRRPATGRAVLAALLVPLVLAACGDAGPPPTPEPSPTPAPTPASAPVIDLPIPDGDTSVTQVLLRSADGTYDVYASVGQLQGASSTCSAVLLDTGESPTNPAYAITNGHCVGIFGANDLLVDQATEGTSVAFDWFIDRPEHRVVPVTRIAWASMRTTTSRSWSWQRRRPSCWVTASGAGGRRQSRAAAGRASTSSWSACPLVPRSWTSLRLSATCASGRAAWTLTR